MLLFKGHLGVAENENIWIDQINLSNWLFPFSTQQLVVALNRANIIGDMYEVYRKLDLKETNLAVYFRSVKNGRYLTSPTGSRFFSKL